MERDSELAPTEGEKIVTDLAIVHHDSAYDEIAAYIGAAGKGETACFIGKQTRAVDLHDAPDLVLAPQRLACDTVLASGERIGLPVISRFLPSQSFHCSSSR
jgi:hypothetical protein